MRRQLRVWCRMPYVVVKDFNRDEPLDANHLHSLWKELSEEDVFKVKPLLYELEGIYTNDEGEPYKRCVLEGDVILNNVEYDRCPIYEELLIPNGTPLMVFSNNKQGKPNVKK